MMLSVLNIWSATYAKKKKSQVIQHITHETNNVTHNLRPRGLEFDSHKQSFSYIPISIVQSSFITSEVMRVLSSWVYYSHGLRYDVHSKWKRMAQLIASIWMCFFRPHDWMHFFYPRRDERNETQNLKKKKRGKIIATLLIIGRNLWNFYS